MVLVWMRDDPKHRYRFHRDPDCWQLNKKPSRGEHRDLIQVELSEIAARPCLDCYPDAPRIKIRHRYCPDCDSVYACEHNGGIAVTDRIGRRHWAWPDINQMPYYRRQAQQ